MYLNIFGKEIAFRILFKLMVYIINSADNLSTAIRRPVINTILLTEANDYTKSLLISNREFCIREYPYPILCQTALSYDIVTSGSIICVSFHFC